MPAGLPEPQGLYDPRDERDSCGIGFVADIKGTKRHGIIADGLRILCNLNHRGATGADPKMGDGSGILIQIPDAFFREECAKAGIKLPPAGDYGVGMCYLPSNPEARKFCEKQVETFIAAEGQKLLGWRDVPVDNSDLGESVKATEPVIRQVFVGRGSNLASDANAFERKLFVIRKQTSNWPCCRGASQDRCCRCSETCCRCCI